MIELSASSMERIIRRVGAERVSDASSCELARVVERKGFVIARRAVEIAASQGRKTVTGEDIRAAARAVNR